MDKHAVSECTYENLITFEYVRKHSVFFCDVIQSLRKQTESQTYEATDWTIPFLFYGVRKYIKKKKEFQYYAWGIQILESLESMCIACQFYYATIKMWGLYRLDQIPSCKKLKHVEKNR